MKKFFLCLIIALFIASPVFAGVSSTAFDSIPEIKKPIEFVFGVLKAIAIIAIVASIFITAIKYISSDAGRRQEILKSGIIAVVISAIVLLIAFSVPKALGLNEAITDSAIIQTII